MYTLFYRKNGKHAESFRFYEERKAISESMRYKELGYEVFLIDADELFNNPRPIADRLYGRANQTEARKERGATTDG